MKAKRFVYVKCIYVTVGLMTETQVFEPKRFASLKQNSEAKCFVEAKSFLFLLPYQREI